MIFLCVQTFPLVYVLMTRRTTAAYVNALEFIHTKLIPLKGKGLIIDFEKAMRAAVKQVTTDLDIYGCWFHFCQSIRRKMMSIKGLSELVRTENKPKKLFRKFQCLALLPAHSIEAAFTDLSRDALKYSQHFTEFIDYFHREWIQIVKPQHFSVFLLDTRTTAAAEAFNGKSNQTFRTHGNFYHFVETLQVEELFKTEQLQSYVDGTTQKSRQDAFFKKRSQFIRKHSIELRDGIIDSRQFLSLMSNTKNCVVFNETEIAVSEVEVEISNNYELMVGDEIEIAYKTDAADSIDISLFELLNADALLSKTAELESIDEFNSDRQNLSVDKLVAESTSTPKRLRGATTTSRGKIQKFTIQNLWIQWYIIVFLSVYFRKTNRSFQAFKRAGFRWNTKCFKFQTTEKWSIDISG